MQIIEAVILGIGQICDKWRAEAEQRRRHDPNDQVAAAIDVCADELNQCLGQMSQTFEFVTPAQYAELHNVTDQTVRNWIRKGELEAHQTAKGSLIRRTASRRRKTG